MNSRNQILLHFSADRDPDFIEKYHKFGGPFGDTCD
jgi:hypothetical protein